MFADLVQYTDENPLFEGRGLRDPSGNYSLISVVAAIFLVNTAELEGREIPRSWADLLEPEWERSISLPVGDFDLFNAILLNIHDRYGDAGVEKLGRSMLLSMHPAQMIKSNRMNRNGLRSPLCLYFFTKTAKEGGTMKPGFGPRTARSSARFLCLRKRSVEQWHNRLLIFSLRKQVLKR